MAAPLSTQSRQFALATTGSLCGMRDKGAMRRRNKERRQVSAAAVKASAEEKSAIIAVAPAASRSHNSRARRMPGKGRAGAVRLDAAAQLQAARLQATHIGVWGVQSTQWQEIRDELAGRQGLSRDDLEMAWQTATQRPHGFLWLALGAPPGEKMWSGFTKKLVKK